MHNNNVAICSQEVLSLGPSPPMPDVGFKPTEIRLIGLSNCLI